MAWEVEHRKYPKHKTKRKKYGNHKGKHRLRGQTQDNVNGEKGTNGEKAIVRIIPILRKTKIKIPQTETRSAAENLKGLGVLGRNDEKRHTSSHILIKSLKF